MRIGAPAVLAAAVILAIAMSSFGPLDGSARKALVATVGVADVLPPPSTPTASPRRAERRRPGIALRPKCRRCAGMAAAASTMSGARVDVLADTQPLLRLGAALLVVGAIVAGLMSLGLPWWLRLLGALVLLACGLGLFAVSARWFTREYPVLTLYADRIAYRGLREQVVMLRNLAGAQVIERRRLGFTLPWLEFEMQDDGDAVSWPLWALQVVPDALLESIAERVHALERDRVPS